LGTQKDKSRSQGFHSKTVIGSRRQKRIEAGLIHRPHRVNTSWHATGCNRVREAGPSDRPQKIEKSYFGSELLHHTLACSGSWLLIDYLVSNDNGSIET